MLPIGSVGIVMVSKSSHTHLCGAINQTMEKLNRGRRPIPSPSSIVPCSFYFVIHTSRPIPLSLISTPLNWVCASIA